MSAVSLTQGAELIRQGHMLAYPTEAVWGLGCDPTNESALEQLIRLKGRSAEKGLILIAGALAQIEPLLAGLTLAQRKHLAQAWPAFITYVLPLPPTHPYPALLTGVHNQIAVRVSTHPLVAALCEHVGPLVSTSANPSGHAAAQSLSELQGYFGQGLAWIEGPLGGESRPSRIVDLVTGIAIRP